MSAPVLSGGLPVRMPRNLLYRWLDYELASFSFRNLTIVAGRKYKFAVDLLRAPAEVVLPKFGFSVREDLGALETRSRGESARIRLFKQLVRVKHMSNLL